MEKKTYSTTKEMLISTPVPQQTRTYKPVSHEQLMDLTLESIYQAGFNLDQELYTGSYDGQIANGRFTISNVSDSEMQLQIGWQNSYNKMLTLKFAIGSRIFICQNGCVSGDYGAFKKKHVGEVQTFTPTAITEYIRAAGDAFRKLQKERDMMKDIQITHRQKAEMLGRMLIDDQFIESTQLNIIEREIKRPTYDYDCADTLWELYQHTTHAMKEVNPRFWMDKHIDAHQFFVNEAGVLVNNRSTVVDVYSQFERKQLELF